jgi:hypothetical protein
MKGMFSASDVKDVMISATCDSNIPNAGEIFLKSFRSTNGSEAEQTV